MSSILQPQNSHRWNLFCHLRHKLLSTFWTLICFLHPKFTPIQGSGLCTRPIKAPFFLTHWVCCSHRVSIQCTKETLDKAVCRKHLNYRLPIKLLWLWLTYFPIQTVNNKYVFNLCTCQTLLIVASRCLPGEDYLERMWEVRVREKMTITVLPMLFSH